MLTLPGMWPRPTPLPRSYLEAVWAVTRTARQPPARRSSGVVVDPGHERAGAARSGPAQAAARAAVPGPRRRQWARQAPWWAGRCWRCGRGRPSLGRQAGGGGIQGGGGTGGSGAGGQGGWRDPGGERDWAVGTLVMA